VAGVAAVPVAGGRGRGGSGVGTCWRGRGGRGGGGEGRGAGGHDTTHGSQFQPTTTRKCEIYRRKCTKLSNGSRRRAVFCTPATPRHPLQHPSPGTRHPAPATQHRSRTRPLLSGPPPRPNQAPAKSPSAALQRVSTICSQASRAAACSACFLERPRPLPRWAPSMITTASKRLAWSGPSSSTR
jgi:hypothetical protein